MRALAVLLALTAACGDTSSSTSTSTSTTGTTADTSTTGGIDCAAPNSCLEHPDVCGTSCACDRELFAELRCVFTESGDYLARCVDGEALVGLCPDGCGYGFYPGDSEPAHCKPPSVCPEDAALCTEDGVLYPERTDAPGSPRCDQAEFCPFGCLPDALPENGYGACCTEHDCLP
ncbi:hypothetical protein OV203_02420 [Nannocystis sp. ILAH1]|uniref:hypothetical protein n=1 Tax=Nannocystis sp. ILAH1 TaxID=2996789 RepID=UPI00226F32D1|nr:hypothetical protein [Nannocystis sp. ILAH1]MCY0985966.1 hypothetical protein [Nannocystis sp. ILAH1]